MTKDVLVSISGMHMGITEPQPDEGDEPIEVVTPASYYCRNGKHYIIYDEVMEVVIKRLHEMKRALVRLRAEADARLFSTSVLIVYDDAHRDRVECRLLDFAKTYFDIARRAQQCHETVEDCEDGVVSALANLIDMLTGIARRTRGMAQSL